MAVEKHFYRGAPQERHQARRHREILRLCSGLKGSLFDYGCGWGDISFALSTNHKVQAVDVDPERVRFAAEQYPEVAFSVCPEDGSGVSEERFDIVTSVVVINFTDPDVYLKEARRILRPGGHLVLAAKVEPPVRTWIKSKMGVGLDCETFVRYRPTRNQLFAKLADHGFSIVKTGSFYDPPFDQWRNPRDAAFKFGEQVWGALGAHWPAPYCSALATI